MIFKVTSLYCFLAPSKSNQIPLVPRNIYSTNRVFAFCGPHNPHICQHISICPAGHRESVLSYCSGHVIPCGSWVACCSHCMRQGLDDQQPFALLPQPVGDFDAQGILGHQHVDLTLALMKIVQCCMTQGVIVDIGTGSGGVLCILDLSSRRPLISTSLS